MMKQWMSLSTVRIGESGLDIFLCVLHYLSPWVGCFGMKITDAALSAGVDVFADLPL